MSINQNQTSMLQSQTLKLDGKPKLQRSRSIMSLFSRGSNSEKRDPSVASGKLTQDALEEDVMGSGRHYGK